MKLPKLAPTQRITIWAPRYHDRTVLIDVKKVGEHNIIEFSKAKSLPEKYYVSGRVARSSPKTTNGKLQCYAIPLDYLELYEGRDD